MSIVSSFLQYINEKSDTIFTIPIEEQKKILLSFQDPKDTIERSYFQYRCQIKMYKWHYRVMFHIGGFFLIFYYAFFNRSGKGNINPSQRYSLVVNSVEMFHTDIYPDSLKQHYPSYILCREMPNPQLRSDDLLFFLKIAKRYPFAYGFLAKVLFNIKKYSYVVHNYKPDAIAVSSEYSFCSSIITKYFHAHGIRSINVQHGEKLFNIRDSFFSFDEFYVWDQHYIQLFQTLRASPDISYHIATPPCLLLSGIQLHEQEQIDFCYYFGDEPNYILRKISKILKFLSQKGYSVRVRCHPCYSDRNLISQIFPLSMIEPSDLAVEESIMRTDKLIALYSTVLFQGIQNNKLIVIDDLSSHERYDKLRGLDYICLTKPHTLLSTYLEGIEKEEVDKIV